MPKDKSLILWLSICAILVYLIIIVGGYTRLTHSGLSIVEWKPISGIIPPLNHMAWEAEFAQYKLSPEYQKVNLGIKLYEFKQIFFVEYIHRILGRLIGVVFLLPFIYFALTKKLQLKEIKYFLYIALLIAFQGFIGWFMVKSGLIDQPNVSQYRLAIHLIIACIILSLLAWKIFPGASLHSKYGYFSYGLLLLQIASGAFVAGLKAGLIYNSFPLMDGQLIPQGLFIMKPWYLNIFENITMVQFIHRSLGIINFVNILAYCFKIFKLKELQKIAIALSCLIIIQLILGILTLILQVPLALALMHQAVAIALMITMIASLKRNKCD
jgi:cytochrome c oxidase assembly protein subunit 15